MTYQKDIYVRLRSTSSV